MAIILSSFYRSVAARRAPDPRARAGGGEATRRRQHEGFHFPGSEHRDRGLPRESRRINIRRAQLLQLLPHRDGWPARPREPQISRQLTDEADNLFTPECLSKMTRVHASAHADGLFRTCAASHYRGSPSVLHARRPCFFP